MDQRGRRFIHCSPGRGCLVLFRLRAAEPGLSFGSEAIYRSTQNLCGRALSP